MENPFKAGGSAKFKHHIKSLTALNDNVLVRDMNFDGRKLSNGIMLLRDDGKNEGIRPRWAQVYAVGPEQKDVVPGQWVFVEHGRWTRGLEVDVDGDEFVLRRVDPKCIIFVSDDEPDADDTISTAVLAEKKSL